MQHCTVGLVGRWRHEWIRWKKAKGKLCKLPKEPPELNRHPAMGEQWVTKRSFQFPLPTALSTPFLEKTIRKCHTESSELICNSSLYLNNDPIGCFQIQTENETLKILCPLAHFWVIFRLFHSAKIIVLSKCRGMNSDLTNLIGWKMEDLLFSS